MNKNYLGDDSESQPVETLTPVAPVITAVKNSGKIMLYVSMALIALLMLPKIGKSYKKIAQ